LFPSWRATVAAVIVFVVLLILLKMHSLTRTKVNVKI
jgi:hypothetical protein